MLELFRMEGMEDSSDYSIQKLDPKTWKRKDVARFVPLIRTSEKDPRMTFWGYPWDVRDLILDTSKEVRLLVSAPECFSDEGAASQIGVFFSGIPTQGEPSDAFLTARSLIAQKDLRLSCQIQCDHDMTVRAVSRLAGSGRADAGKRPEDLITPMAVWTTPG